MVKLSPHGLVDRNRRRIRLRKVNVRCERAGIQNTGVSTHGRGVLPALRSPRIPRNPVCSEGWGSFEGGSEEAREIDVIAAVRFRGRSLGQVSCVCVVCV